MIDLICANVYEFDGKAEEKVLLFPSTDRVLLTFNSELHKKKQKPGPKELFFPLRAAPPRKGASRWKERKKDQASACKCPKLFSEYRKSKKGKKRKEATCDKSSTRHAKAVFPQESK